MDVYGNERTDGPKRMPKRSLGSCSAQDVSEYRGLLYGILNRDALTRHMRVAPHPFAGPPEWQCSSIAFRQGPSGPYAVALARIRGVGLPTKNFEKDSFPLPRSRAILTGLSTQVVSPLYILCGNGAEIALYMGVKAEGPSIKSCCEGAAEARETLIRCLVSAYPAVDVRPLRAQSEYEVVLSHISKLGNAVSLVGNPSANSDEGGEDIHIDRLIRALLGTQYCFFVEAVPISLAATAAALETVSGEMAEVHRRGRFTSSEQNSSLGQISREELDPFAQRCETLLDIACNKIEAGLCEGMWETHTTLVTAGAADARRGAAMLRAIFGGDESKPEPVNAIVHDSANKEVKSWLDRLVSPVACDGSCGYVRTAGFRSDPLETPLPSSDAGLMFDLPTRELPGFCIQTVQDFAVDVDCPGKKRVGIGRILGMTGPTDRDLALQLDHLTRHALVVGVTGSGKTNTVLGIVDQVWRRHGIPFLVIEPAKTHYRDLLANKGFEGLRIFCPGLGDVAPFRLNPFEFPPGVSVQTHIANLYAAFNAAFVLYSPMPYVLERSLGEVYQERGWDLSTGEHPERKIRSNRLPSALFPTLTQLHRKVGDVVERLGYDTRITMDVRAGLQARIDSLRTGQKGQTFDCPRSFPFEELLQKPCVLELSHIGSDEEKAFLMGLFLMRLYEARIAAGEAEGLQHITVVEEAHRFLADDGGGTGGSEQTSVRSKAVETFCNMLAEIRAYGEGLVVAEQIPSKLARDVLKNTNLKVMHRIVARDDRELMSGAMNVKDEQGDAVASLQCGEAVVYAEGLKRPCLVQVPRFDSVGIADHEDVREAAARYFQRHLSALRQLPGCDCCDAACRFSALVRRVEESERIESRLWGYAVSCMVDEKIPTTAWLPLSAELAASFHAPGFSGREWKSLTWCAFVIGVESTFSPLYARPGVTMEELDEVLEAFVRVADAARRRDTNAAQAARTAFVRDLETILRTPGGPLLGCDACNSKCIYEHLGRFLGAQAQNRRGLSASMKSADPAASVQTFCRTVSRTVLFTEDRKSVDSLAMCFYLHVHNALSDTDPLDTVGRLFCT